MKVVIPMAGQGERFVRAGYADPKPLIVVNGKPIIQYIVEMFSPEDDFVFICNRQHLETTAMREVLQRLAPNGSIINIESHKRGPIHTMMAAQMDTYLNDQEEVIICYCDNPYLWNYTDFLNFVHQQKSDGCILTHVGFHPHRLSPTLMAFLKQQDGVVSEIKEKAAYTDNPMQEHASTGTYYFRTGAMVKQYLRQTMDRNINYNGEFYITLVYNLLIEDGLRVNCYATEFATVFGTPEEVENFKAWQTILGGIQVKNEEQLIQCYRYWRAYNEFRNS